MAFFASFLLARPSPVAALKSKNILERFRKHKLVREVTIGKLMYRKALLGQPEGLKGADEEFEFIELHLIDIMILACADGSGWRSCGLTLKALAQFGPARELGRQNLHCNRAIEPGVACPTYFAICADQVLDFVMSELSAGLQYSHRSNPRSDEKPARCGPRAVQIEDRDCLS